MKKIYRIPEIEKNVPIRFSKYFWLWDMEVTDSVLLTSDETKKLRSYITKLKQKNSNMYDLSFDDKKFKFDAEGNGFRMWRTK